MRFAPWNPLWNSRLFHGHIWVLFHFQCPQWPASLGTNGSVLSGLSIFYYWGDFCFCFHKHPTVPHVRRLCPSAGSTTDAWGLSCVTCLPCACSLVVVLPPVHSHTYFSMTIKNVSRHWWSLLEWGKGRVPLVWSHCCSTTIWCSPMSEHDQG